MTLTGRPHRAGENTGTARVIALSDGVFAIAMTLLAFRIQVPRLSPHEAHAQLSEKILLLWPDFSIFVLSFVVISVFWAAHHRVFDHIRAYDINLVRINLLFLLCISFLPFPVAFFAENETHPLAVAFYAASMAATSLTLTGLQWYAARSPQLLHEHLDPADVEKTAMRNLVVPALFLASIGLAYVNITLAITTWLLIPVARRLLGPIGWTVTSESSMPLEGKSRTAAGAGEASSDG